MWIFVSLRSVWSIKLVPEQPGCYIEKLCLEKQNKQNYFSVHVLSACHVCVSHAGLVPSGLTQGSSYETRSSVRISVPNQRQVSLSACLYFFLNFGMCVGVDLAIFSAVLHLIFRDRVSHWIKAYWFGLTGWLASSRDPLLSIHTSLILERDEYGHAQLVQVLGIQTQVLMLAWHILNQVSSSSSSLCLPLDAYVRKPQILPASVWGLSAFLVTVT